MTSIWCLWWRKNHRKTPRYCHIFVNLKIQCYEMDMDWRSKHFNQYFLCMRWWFSRPFNRCLLKPSSEFPSLWLVCDCSLVPTSHWLQENAQELTCHRRLSVWFYRITGCFL
jgi:hypothetical protein